jgi:hypothetical protein
MGTIECDPRYLGGRAVEALARYHAANLIMPGDKMYWAVAASALRRYWGERTRDQRGVTL